MKPILATNIKNSEECKLHDSHQETYMKEKIMGLINEEILIHASQKKIIVELSKLFISPDKFQITDEFMDNILNEYRSVGWDVEIFKHFSFVYRHQINLINNSL